MPIPTSQTAQKRYLCFHSIGRLADGKRVLDRLNLGSELETPTQLTGPVCRGCHATLMFLLSSLDSTLLAFSLAI